jgi:YHS domain-containing protein
MKRMILLLSLVVVLAVSIWAFAPDDTKMTDPVCHMKGTAAEMKFTSIYDGKTYNFCSAECKAKFDKAPAKFIAAKAEEKKGCDEPCDMAKDSKACGKADEKKADEKKGCAKVDEKKCDKAEMKKECKKGQEACCADHKGMKIERKPIDKGVVITVVCENAECVKKMQEMAAKCAAGCEAKKDVVADAKCAAVKDEKKAGCGAKCPVCHMMGCCAKQKDIKVKVTNIEKGIAIELTTDNPESLKHLKECKGTCQK